MIDRDVEAVARMSLRPDLRELSPEIRDEVIALGTRELAGRARPALIAHLVLMVLATLASGNHQRAFAGYTLANGALWGLLALVVTHDWGVTAPALIHWLVVAGVAAGGAASLKPSCKLAVGFALLLLLPIAVACVREASAGPALGGIVVSYFLFLMGLARETSKSYWDAVIAGALLRARGAELALASENTNRDLAIAERVFRKIIDRSTLDLPSLRAHTSSLERFNGDVVMVVPIAGRRLRMLMGDFTGHGLGAAVGAMPVADVFFATADRGLPLETALREMNRKLRMALPRGMFLAAFAAELDVVSGRLIYWNGGCPAGLVLAKDGLVRASLESEHVPLGIVDDAQLETTLSSVSLTRDDRLFVCTDGVVEATGPQGGLFGAERLRAALAEAPEAPFKSQALDQALAAHRHNGDPHDDTTYLEVRFDEALPRDVAARCARGRERPWRTETFELRFDPQRLRVSDPLFELRAFLEDRLVSEREISIAHTVIAELFLNAVDHGLLRLDSTMKQPPGGIGRYFSEREARLARLNEGLVAVHIELDDDGTQQLLRVRVEDSGNGFVLPPRESPAIGHQPFGRGIALVRSFCRKAVWIDGGRVAEAELVISGGRRPHDYRQLSA